MSLKKVTTSVSYKVPAWTHCNLQGNIFGQPSKEKCRFCVKEKGFYRCTLYNEVLDTSQGTLVDKADACNRATRGYNSIVEDVEPKEPVPSVDPKTLMKTTIAEYNKIRKQLLNQGYPETLADKLASEYVLGGK